jgi:signal peptidase I
MTTRPGDVRLSEGSVEARDAGPSPYVAYGGASRLSNPAQLELLRGVAERGVPLRTVVYGFSMTPFIRGGDVVVIAPTAGTELHVGDVVACALPGGRRMAVHRVVARAGDGWVVRGDNCPEPDGVLARSAIIGRVVQVERGGRRVHLGFGAQGAWVAAASRSGALAGARTVWRAPRGAAARALRAVQSLPMYRHAGRRLATPFVVAEATQDDMMAVWRHLGGLPPDGRQVDPHVVRLVAHRNGRVVGYAELVRNPEAEGPWAGDWLFSLTVWGPYRGQGIGEALVRRVVAEAEVRGAEDLRLVVQEDNARAIGLYRKLGFAPCTVEALEPLLLAEQLQYGCRRVVLRRALWAAGAGMAGATRRVRPAMHPEGHVMEHQP